MKWRGRRQSSNIDDRRGRRIGRKAGIGGIWTIVIVLGAMYFGIDPRVALNIGEQLGGGSSNESTPYQPTAEEQELAQFVAVVLADTEDAWRQIFSASGNRYIEPQLVMFTGAVNSGCGFAQSAMGPFYCPTDSKVYIDLGFYSDLKKRHNAPGDFAQAYVIAHEVGHHVQHLLGISDKVHELKKKVGKAEANALSVRLELQADCFAGVWANRTENAKAVLEQGDVEEALNAASAIGDDRLQKQATGSVSPESFTHGTSRQRVRWFKEGWSRGDVGSCNTFEVDKL